MGEKITIQGYLKNLGFHPPVENTYSRIAEWMEWYRNDVKRFHKYWIFDGVSRRKEERYRLGMAKKVCEDWANLILNEKVAIKAGNYEDRLNDILEKNEFSTRGNQLIELSFALGTGAFVEYKGKKDEVIIDFVRADMIYPLSYDNNKVTECAFGSYRNYRGTECIYLQIHRLGQEGEKEDQYYIDNKYVNINSGEEMDLPEDLLRTVDTGSCIPLFQIITPNMVNNVDLDSPMGLSVFANAIDQIKSCDLVFDSYMNEFVLGRKRLLVPISMAKMIQIQEGSGQAGDRAAKMAPEFDPSETVFYQMPADRNSDLKPTAVDMTIRATDHELGIQRALDLCSFKCGMGTGRYRFDGAGVKTATEVISDKSDLYQNLKKNEIPVKAAVIGMVKAIAFLDGRTEVDPTVDFDDSVIEDGNAVIDKNIKLVTAKLRSKITAIMEIEKCDENTAREELERIAEEGQIEARQMDWYGMEDVEDEPSEEEKSPNNPAGSEKNPIGFQAVNEI